jgi:hypothetical protein
VATNEPVDTLKCMAEPHRDYESRRGGGPQAKSVGAVLGAGFGGIERA